MDEAGTEFIEPQLLRLPLKQIIVDHTYQRQVSLDHVRTIARNFDPVLLGVVTVNVRDDGGVYVIDGQHRIEALRQIMAVDDVLCLVYYGLSQEIEAKLFSGPQTTRRGLTPIARFRAAIVAHDPAALELLETIERNGFVVHWGGKPTGTAPRVNAIANLESIKAKAIPGHLDDVLTVLREGWRERGPLVAPVPVLTGLDVVMRRHRKLYDRKVLSAAVASVSFEEFADLMKSAPTNNLHQRVEYVLCRLYNKVLDEKGSAALRLIPMVSDPTPPVVARRVA